MDTLIVVAVGIYLFIESFTAINEMPKIKLRAMFCEIKNLYTLKYVGVGLYGLFIAYHASKISGWQVMLILPAIFCVLERTIYRIKSSRDPFIRYISINHKQKKVKQ